jgi:hypothetical protein
VCSQAEDCGSYGFNGFAVVDRDLSRRTGIEYWARSTERLFAAHFEVLNALPLVRRDDSDCD